MLFTNSYFSTMSLNEFERMEKQKNVGKRNFKQIDKIHRKNKRKRGKK